MVAVTVNVYGVPFVRPVTVIGDALPLTTILPGELVTVYPVIEGPPVPVNAGGVNLTVACPSPAVAATEVGAPGTTALTAKL